MTRSQTRFVIWSILAAICGQLVAIWHHVEHGPSRDDPPVRYEYNEEPYQLPPGPHLFVDWRYVFTGRTHYYLPDGKDAPRYDLKKELMSKISNKPDQVP